MAAERIPFVTPEEYLDLERKAETKSEYLSGQIFAMAGGTPGHSQIGFNFISVLGRKLAGGPCRGYTNDLRVAAGTLFTYPDITVVCGEPKFHDEKRDTLTNPTLIVEVLSDSTEAFDRGEKFAHYRRAKSLREYILVSQRLPRVERYLIEPDGSWNYSAVEGLDATIRLETVNCDIPLEQVYEGVEFPPSPEPGKSQED